MTAYQITSMMEYVVQAGTATVVKEVGKPIAGKTGTTNDEKDAWFIGFSPDLVVGIYVGYDKPRNLGKGATGGHLAAPIAKDFLKLALADKPATPFKVPAGIKLVRVDAKSGMRAGPGEGGRTILEAFKPGTAPPDNYSVIGVADADGSAPPQGAPPEPSSSGCRDRWAVLSATDCALRRTPLHPGTLHPAKNSGSHRRSETPCAPKSNASLKRSSSLSGC